MCSGHEMKLVTRNIQGDLALRGSFLQPQEVVGLENARANLQANLDNITGLQETAVMSISHEGHVWSKGHYFYLTVNVAVIRTFHITMRTQDCAMKLVRQHFSYLYHLINCTFHMTRQSPFDSLWRWGEALLSLPLKMALGPTQPPIKCLVGAPMPGIRGWGIMLTTQTMLQVEKHWRSNSTRRPRFTVCCNFNLIPFHSFYDNSGDDM